MLAYSKPKQCRFLRHSVATTNISILHRFRYIITYQGRIKASTGPGAVPNSGRLQTYNQLTAFCCTARLALRVQIGQFFIF